MRCSITSILIAICAFYDVIAFNNDRASGASRLTALRQNRPETDTIKTLAKSYQFSVREALKALAFGTLSIAVGSKSSRGSVFMDTDAYGDKELKQAAINNLKQKLRNSINHSPEVAKSYFELAVCDALGYDAQTSDGGLDGSFVYEGAPDTLNAGIKGIETVKSDLQQSLSVSLADVSAYAGAEACEAIGAPRIVVQLGRSDAKIKNKKEPAFNIFGDSSEAPLSDVKAVFAGSGLSVKDAAALLCAHGELRRTLKELRAKKAASQAEDDDDKSELDDEQVFVPTSFGRRDEIWGPKISDSFSNRYISSLLKSTRKSAPSEITLTLLDRLLIEDPEYKAIAQSFASSNKDLLETLPSAYIRLTTLGQTLSRAKD